VSWRPSAQQKRDLRKKFDNDRFRMVARSALNATIALEVSTQRVIDSRWTPLRALSAGSMTAVIKTFERPREVRRLVASIRRVQPDLPVLIADDSRAPEPVAGAELLALPFNSGISFGRNAALRQIETPYFLLLDDDFIFYRHTRLEDSLEIIVANPEIDILGGRVVNLPDFSTYDYSRLQMFPQALPPKFSTGTVIGGLAVQQKVPNFFIGRTSSVSSVGWAEELKVMEHQDFFTRASGILTTVYNDDLRVLHARNPFDRSSPERAENQAQAQVEFHKRYYGPQG
jgi:hypothetical protein